MEPIKFGNFSFVEIEYCPEHLDLFKRLFAIEDVENYFIMPTEYRNDTRNYVANLHVANKKQTALNFVIVTNDNQNAGIFTAEVKRFANGEVYWNIGYALLNEFRGKGLATQAVNSFASFAQRFSINKMVLDISVNNHPSAKVAERCGFEKEKSDTGGYVGLFDIERPEVEMRYRWIRNIREVSKRDELCLKALEAFNQQKNYILAIVYYKGALQEKASIGSPWTDGQIYSNLGISYSASKQYATAYECLKKAWDLGIQNPTVIKELRWLEEHRYLW
jgi:RimJ/RimL family protein N-acetyltransferase